MAKQLQHRPWEAGTVRLSGLMGQVRDEMVMPDDSRTQSLGLSWGTGRQDEWGMGDSQVRPQSLGGAGLRDTRQGGKGVSLQTELSRSTVGDSSR